MRFAIVTEIELGKEGKKENKTATGLYVFMATAVVEQKRAHVIDVSLF